MTTEIRATEGGEQRFERATKRKTNWEAAKDSEGASGEIAEEDDKTVEEDELFRDLFEPLEIPPDVPPIYSEGGASSSRSGDRKTGNDEPMIEPNTLPGRRRRGTPANSENSKMRKVNEEREKRKQKEDEQRKTARRIEDEKVKRKSSEQDADDTKRSRENDDDPGGDSKMEAETLFMSDGEELGSCSKLDRKILSAILRGVDVTEVYSPERVTKACMKAGMRPGSSMDITNGWDFTKAEDRKRAWKTIRE